MIQFSANNAIATRLMLAAAIGVITLNQAAAQQPGSLIARTSTSSVRVAEPFTLEFTVTAPAGAKVTFPSTAEKLGDFDVVDRQDLFDIPDATTADARTWTRRLTLESIVTGQLSIPSIEVQVSGQKGSQVIRSNPIAVQVVSVLEDRGDPTKFRDIQSVVDVSVPTTHSRGWLWWTMGGAAALALLAAAGLVLSRRGQWVTPREWALQELDELEKSLDSATIDSEAIASKLSKIVRDYLQLQFAIPETGGTTQELVRSIESNQQLAAEITNQLRELFTLADKVKFAGLQLSPEGLASAIKGSRDLVQRIADASQTEAQTSDATENQ